MNCTYASVGRICSELGRSRARGGAEEPSEVRRCWPSWRGPVWSPPQSWAEAALATWAGLSPLERLPMSLGWPLLVAVVGGLNVLAMALLWRMGRSGDAIPPLLLHHLLVASDLLLILLATLHFYARSLFEQHFLYTACDQSSAWLLQSLENVLVGQLNASHVMALYTALFSVLALRRPGKAVQLNCWPVAVGVLLLSSVACVALSFHTRPPRLVGPRACSSWGRWPELRARKGSVSDEDLRRLWQEGLSCSLDKGKEDGFGPTFGLAAQSLGISALFLAAAEANKAEAVGQSGRPSALSGVLLGEAVLSVLSSLASSGYDLLWTPLGWRLVPEELRRLLSDLLQLLTYALTAAELCSHFLLFAALSKRFRLGLRQLCKPQAPQPKPSLELRVIHVLQNHRANGTANQ